MTISRIISFDHATVLKKCVVNAAKKHDFILQNIPEELLFLALLDYEKSVCGKHDN